MNPKIRISYSAYRTCDIVLYDMPNTKLVDWFALIDIWGSPGYDRFKDGGLYFEIPREMCDIIPTLPFVKKYQIEIVKY